MDVTSVPGYRFSVVINRNQPCSAAFRVVAPSPHLACPSEGKPGTDSGLPHEAGREPGLTKIEAAGEIAQGGFRSGHPTLARADNRRRRLTGRRP